MRLKIHHKTSYNYPKPIFPEPQHLYFFPLQREYIQLENHTLKVLPAPTGNATRLDIENNQYQQCWFNELTEHLTIDVEMILSLSTLNQFNFFVEEKSKTGHDKALDLYTSDLVELDQGIIRWLNELKDENPTQFVGDLCDSIHNRWAHTTSYNPDLLNPNECFNSEAASCRDLAWMMIQLLRNKDYPSRFVSGYSYNPEIVGHELHAWVEVWIAGAGWIGLDPSSGLFITETYIPISASYHPVNTLPIQGSFRGKGESNLETSVDISLID